MIMDYLQRHSTYKYVHYRKRAVLFSKNYLTIVVSGKERFGWSLLHWLLVKISKTELLDLLYEEQENPLLNLIRFCKDIPTEWKKYTSGLRYFGKSAVRSARFRHEKVLTW